MRSSRITVTDWTSIASYSSIQSMSRGLSRGAQNAKYFFTFLFRDAYRMYATFLFLPLCNIFCLLRCCRMMINFLDPFNDGLHLISTGLARSLSFQPDTSNSTIDDNVWFIFKYLIIPFLLRCERRKKGNVGRKEKTFCSLSKSCTLVKTSMKFLLCETWWSYVWKAFVIRRNVDALLATLWSIFARPNDFNSCWNSRNFWVNFHRSLQS